MLQDCFKAGLVIPAAVEGREDVLDLVLCQPVEQAHERVEFCDQVILLGLGLQANGNADLGGPVVIAVVDCRKAAGDPDDTLSGCRSLLIDGDR